MTATDFWQQYVPAIGPAVRFNFRCDCDIKASAIKRCSDPAVRFNFRCDCDRVVIVTTAESQPAVRFNFRCDCDKVSTSRRSVKSPQ